ncbi:anthranilate phosphoribosyltransferase [Thiohalorhabdus denitrificans]|uniref:Anthranilate phosphoribosyltransferase n=1 Tax=Thiohalorhabdus denitrificans TaxID=381306 RepID=A0A1G5EQU7_9GAMM|nr:anthranilate phosphoribosyltransferase [Thiohalorhabdus denitrificans]SCY29294.1 anthranilate phosphoribosyltransferase [Thiohalorhabdus denitrificans]
MPGEMDLNVRTKNAIARLVEREDLPRADMEEVMREIMRGQSAPEEIAGFLTALRMKGETVEEITGAVAVMREFATRIEVDAPNLVDTCGTGGDLRGTFNISTASAFVAAGAGANVAKHGNRSVSSKSGSADVLTALGVDLDIEAEEVGRAIDEVGIGFLFAPRHHGAMKHAVGPRQALGIRTLFNLLGPLANPALAPNQVLGVFDSHWLEPLAQVLRELGSRHVLVVHADDGMDELSILGPTRMAELFDGDILHHDIDPEQFGFERPDAAALQAGDADENAAILRAVLHGEGGPKRDIVLLNAGAALYVGGVAASLEDGVEAAARSIDSGAAAGKLEQLAAFTRKARKAQ